MSLKKKLGMGIASAALGISLVGGGTFAFFNDTADTSGSFTAGTLKLSASPTEIINVTDIKPGDTMYKPFNLHNDGSLDISKVLLTTKYTVINKAGESSNVDDFGKHIRVNFLFNEDKALLGPASPDQIIYRTTLYDLKNMSPDAVENNIFIPWLEEIGGLESGDTDKLHVQFEFVDNGLNQNEFQGDSLSLEWTFEGKQGAGEAK